MKFLRVVLGIDVGMDSIAVSFGTMSDGLALQVATPRSFANTAKSHEELHRWVTKLRKKSDVPCVCVMEATGVYYEHLAHFLHAHGYIVVVMLPNKVYHYAKTRSIKSKTDRIDAQMLAFYGLERPGLRPWCPPSQVLLELRTLTRERRALNLMITQITNRIHAVDHTYTTPDTTRDRLSAQSALLKQQVGEIDARIEQVLSKDPWLEELIGLITTIPGVGRLTAVTIVAETQGFALITNGRQLASYAGLDVVQHESGRMARRGKISKKGNHHLRTIAYMAALSAVKHNPIMRSFHKRLTATKEQKKISLIAVARKLLLLVYAVWKSGKPFDPHFQESVQTGAVEQDTSTCTLEEETHSTQMNAPVKHQTRIRTLQVPRNSAVKSAPSHSVYPLLTALDGALSCACGDGAGSS
jgi:transposase